MHRYTNAKNQEPPTCPPEGGATPHDVSMRIQTDLRQKQSWRTKTEGNLTAEQNRRATGAKHLKCDSEEGGTARKRRFTFTRPLSSALHVATECEGRKQRWHIQRFSASPTPQTERERGEERKEEVNHGRRTEEGETTTGEKEDKTKGGEWRSVEDKKNKLRKGRKKKSQKLNRKEVKRSKVKASRGEKEE